VGSSQEPFGESRLPEGSGNIVRSHKAEEKKNPRKMIRYTVLVRRKIASYHDNNSLVMDRDTESWILQQTGSSK
jgi:hypothetical protein